MFNLKTEERKINHKYKSLLNQLNGQFLFPDKICFFKFSLSVLFKVLKSSFPLLNVYPWIKNSLKQKLCSVTFPVCF